MGGHDGIDIDHPVLVVMYLVYWQGRKYQQPINVDTERIFEIQTDDDHFYTSSDEISPLHTEKNKQWLEVNLMNYDELLCATIVGIL